MIEALVKEKVEQIKKIGQFMHILIDDDVAEKRYNICLECEYFINKRCKFCRCYMPAKVLFKRSHCPKQYWE